MRFAPLKTTPPGMFRRVPPVIFLPFLGAAMLVLAWQRAVSIFALPAGPVGLMAGAVTAAGAFAFFAYGAKLGRRPGVLSEDLRILPGRAGCSAALVSLSAFACVLAEFAPGFATALLIGGIGLHLAYWMVLIQAMIGHAERRRVSPLWQLDFAGLIVAALAALMLDWTGLARLLFWVSAAAAGMIWVASVAQARRERVSPPLRPLLALHAAPLAVLGSVAAGLGMAAMALLAGTLSLAALLIGAIGARWLTEGGFSPFWGAFTIPLTAQAGLFLTLAGVHPLWRLSGAVTLVGATLVTLTVLFRIWRDWTQGRLAIKTNAAVA